MSHALFGIANLVDEETCLISAENVTGAKGRGARDEPNLLVQTEATSMGQPASLYSKAAGELGRGYKVRPCTDIPPQATITIMDFAGPGTIQHIWITCSPSFWRDLIVRIWWDGEATPSVEVPLGDLFCNGWKLRHNILAMPINVNPQGGFNCYFPMPFRGHARISIENRALEKLPNFFYAITCARGPVAEQAAYFHASFRRSNPLPLGHDHVIVDGIQGRGHYVGTYMAWQQNSNGWWGEGEFKAFIDGDTEFPSIVGTGTEDYFGGAWCFGSNYSAPFLGYQDLNLSRGTNQTGNRHSMYRFHLLDPIRFKSDLRVTMQALGWRSDGRYLPLQDDIHSVAYWYQAEPHAPFPTLPDRNALEII